MPAVLQRLWRLLRSRSLAAALIVALTAFAVINTLVPSGSGTDAAVRAWAGDHPIAEAVVGPLGFHRGYTAPLFVALLVLLTASTIACATERTAAARRVLRSTWSPSDSYIETLRTRPQATVQAPSGVASVELATSTAAALRRVGFRAETHGSVVHARAGMIGPLGSATFHWAIVALILTAAAGQATRAEGFLGLPVGDQVSDVRSSYLQVDEGPLFGGRYTGIGLVATDVIRHYLVDGIDRGSAPLIKAFENGVEVASQRVYPNSPLRVGCLLVHNAAFGPAAVVAVERPPGGELSRSTLLLERSATSSSGTAPQRFSLRPGPPAPVLDVRLQVVVRRGAEATGSIPWTSRAVVETATAGTEDFGPPVTVLAGQALPLPGGYLLRLVEVKDWVRVSVANDWSVPVLYAVFVIAIAALAAAVLAPVRRVIAVVVEHDDGLYLHIATRHSRQDPTFQSRVEEAVRQALEAPEKP